MSENYVKIFQYKYLINLLQQNVYIYQFFAINVRAIIFAIKISRVIFEIFFFA